YDDGYFYPGPAVKDVPITLAPERSRQAIQEFGRPQYDKLISEFPTETPLEAKAMVTSTAAATIRSTVRPRPVCFCMPERHGELCRANGCGGRSPPNGCSSLLASGSAMGRSRCAGRAIHLRRRVDASGQAIFTVVAAGFACRRRDGINSRKNNYARGYTGNESG